MPALRFAWAALAAVLVAPGSAPAQEIDPAAAARFAELALTCVHREYPNKIAHVLSGDADVRPPRELTPAFYGCYDWHSSVHGHWLLARLARLLPDAPLAAPARAALARSLTPENVAGEVAYLGDAGRVSFERPYGLAWLLQLHAELREWDDPDARAWARTLEPLVIAAAGRLREWMPKLGHPIRVGEHDQTAFAFALARDWARIAGDRPMLELLDERVRALYLTDRDCPLAYEPSGQDFLSPCRRGRAPGGGAPGRQRRALRGWALAGELRDLPGHRAGAIAPAPANAGFEGAGVRPYTQTGLFLTRILHLP